MALFLVRHAVAVGRSGWVDADELRPLTARGQRQSKALLRLFETAKVRRILSSPAVRCHDTVVPLAESLELPIADLPALAEGRGARKALDLVAELAPKKGDSVLCSHGDLIPEILQKLARNGLEVDEELRCAKGSTWELTTGGHDFLSARYHPPAE